MIPKSLKILEDQRKSLNFEKWILKISIKCLKINKENSLETQENSGEIIVFYIMKISSTSSKLINFFEAAAIHIISQNLSIPLKNVLLENGLHPKYTIVCPCCVLCYLKSNQMKIFSQFNLKKVIMRNSTFNVL